MTQRGQRLTTYCSNGGQGRQAVLLYKYKYKLVQTGSQLKQDAVFWPGEEQLFTKVGRNARKSHLMFSAEWKMIEHI